MKDFENYIAHISSCILIFLESPGTFAELGLFAARKPLARKTFLVKDTNFQGHSFINLGPAHYIGEMSDFGNPQYVSLSSSPKHGMNLDQVFENLKEQFNTEHRGRIPRDRYKFATPGLREIKNVDVDGDGDGDVDGDDFDCLNDIYKTWFFVTLEIVNLFRILPLREIKIIFEVIFKKRIETQDTIWLFSILESAGFIKTKFDKFQEKGYVIKSESTTSFMEGKEPGKLLEAEDEYNRLRVDIFDYYEKFAPQIIEVWNERNDS